MAAIDVVQITDLHVDADPEARMHGRDTHATLIGVLKAIGANEQPDLILATGDLVADPSVAAYERVGNLLGRASAAVFALPGNHDDWSLMTQHLERDNVPLAFSIAAGPWRIVMVDSTVKGEVFGRLDSRKVTAVEREIIMAREPHVLIAIHHPPAPIGSPLDDVGLQNTNDLFRMMDRQKRVRGLIWGHNHHIHDSERKGVRLLGAPSTCIQFSANPDDGFKPTDEPPAYRRIGLNEDGSIETEVVWVPEALAA